MAAAAWSPDTAMLVPVVSKQVSRTLDLPGEFLPFLSVSLHAKVPGYVERVLVDRGSVVKQGRSAGRVERARIEGADRRSANRRCGLRNRTGCRRRPNCAAAQSTYERLKKAAETPGAVAGNELIQAEKQVEAAQALVRSREASQPRRTSGRAGAERYGGISPDHGALRWSGDRSPGPSRRAGGSRRRSRVAGDPAGIAPSASGSRPGGRCRRNRARRHRLVSRSGLSGTQLLGHGRADRRMLWIQNAHHGGGTGCFQSGWVACLRACIPR